METHFIRQSLQRVRTHLARLTLLRDLWLSSLLMATLGTTVVWYEKTLYLPTKVRALIMFGMVDLVLVLVLVMIVRWFGIWRGWWPWISIRALAGRVGHRLGQQTDRLLNALQLEDRLARETEIANADLLAQSVELTAAQLRDLDLRTLTPRRYRPPVRPVWLLLILIALAWGTAPGKMYQATKRYAHPGRDYPIPTPFILLSLSGDQEVLGGDTVKVVFTAFGKASPPEIEVVWTNQAGRSRISLAALRRDRYVYQFDDIRDDVSYYARVRNPNWFSHWEEIRSATYNISLSDRPIIEELSFRITPPVHTGETTQTIGGNVADITTLTGSRVEFKATTNLPLVEALVHLGEEEIPLEVNRTKVKGEFILEESTTMFITVRDRRDVVNANPIHYKFTALADYPPTLTIIMPVADVELDESMLVPLQFDVSDDFGFSQAQITYEIRKPEYLTQDDQIYTRDIPELAEDRRSQRITHLWDLNAVGLLPGDEVHFHLEVYDNNLVSGPGQAVSSTIVARVPTLTDLFTQVAGRSDQTAEATNDMLEDLEAVRSLLEEMEQVMRDEGQVTWEQQQKGKEVLQTLEQVLKHLEQVQQDIRELGEKSEDNQLFSPDLLQKYDELQHLLEEIMTAELEEAMRRMREALESMDPERYKQALQNMQFQADEFEAQLDRFLDIFKRALAEMKMDEVVRRLEEMVLTEEQLLQELESVAESGNESGQSSQNETTGDESDRRLRDLAARHTEQERSLEGLRETMRDAAGLMKPFSNDAADRLGELPDNDLARETQAELAQGTRALQGGNPKDGESGLKQSKEMLSLMHQEAADIQDQFQESTVQEMMSRFQRVLSGVLTTSKQQEAQHDNTARMPRSSPRVREAAEEQHNLLKSLSQVIEQLMALSRQSFNVTPEMGRAVGRANAAMNKSVEQLAAGEIRDASESQQAAMTALNEAAVALNNAMQAMEMSGSASGYEQYLQRMQNLTQGQQGLNQQTLSMQLGQMAAMSRAELMRRLQARQRQLSQALEEILQEYPSQSGGQQGGLSQAQRDMEEIIKDFQRRRVTRRTLDRQQRIVSRLLDHQKSLAVDDFKDERQGRAATERFAYDGPRSLQTDLGQHEDAILQAMEKALREGYSQDYQVIIQSYFRQLAGQASAGK